MNTDFFEPVKITNPVFMEINIDKLLKEVDGLSGFDLFYGCVIEMSPKHRTFSTYDPIEYKSMAVTKKLNGRECF